MPGGLDASSSPPAVVTTGLSTGSLDKIRRSVSFSSEVRPDVENLVKNPSRSRSRESTKASSMRINQVQTLESELGPLQQEDVIEFTSQVYYGKEESGYLSLEVVRLGKTVGKATVDYLTCDGSARAGEKYEAASGSLEFEAGERCKRIHVKVLSDDKFDATLEFGLRLENPRGARLGKYLYECRIMIVDDDAFPTNKYKTLLDAGLASEIPYWPLIFEYFTMHMQDRDFRRSFASTLICDQISNLKYIWAILLTNYMVDNVLKPPDGEEVSKDKVHVQTTMLVLAALTIVPHALLFVIDRFKAYRRVGGKAISKLQQNLLRKFLNYDTHSRILVSASDLQMAITRDVPELVDGAFSSIFGILRKLGLLAVFIGLQVQKFGSSIPFTAGCFIGFPVLTWLFLWFRQRGTKRCCDNVFTGQTGVVSFIQQTTDCYRLINDYMQRPAMISLFTEKVIASNKANLENKVWNITNKAFTPVLTTIMCGCFVLSSYNDVLDGGPIGEFLTGCAIWKGVGDCYQEIFSDVRELQSTIAPLQNIVFYMNLPVDVPYKMHRMNQLLEDSHHGLKVAEAQLAKKQTSHHSPFIVRGSTITTGCFTDEVFCATDLLMISARNISFEYPKKEGGIGNIMLHDASFDIPQGKLVAITGPRGAGKATLLNLIGGVLQLDECNGGKLFVPPHLRVLNVSSEPQSISDLDLFANLCFGPLDAGDQHPKRVLGICRRLGMSHEIIHLVEQHAEHFPSESPEKKKQGFKRSGSAASVVSQVSQLSNFGQLEHRAGSKIQVGTAYSVTKRRGAELMANDGNILSKTDRILIHLARAFVMNPDVLIMHKPVAQLDEYHARLVLDFLREFVDLRGIEKSPQSRQVRRPRTCIFSVADSRIADVADKVFHVAQGNVSPIDIHDLEMLRHIARKLFEAMDLNADNLVNRKEFIQAVQEAPWAAELVGVAKDGDVHEALGDIFDMLDRSNNGEVDFDDLVQYLRTRFDGALPQVIAALHTAESPTNKTSQSLLARPKSLNSSSSKESKVTDPFQSPLSTRDAWKIPEIAIEVPMFAGSPNAHDLHGRDLSREIN